MFRPALILPLLIAACSGGDEETANASAAASPAPPQANPVQAQTSPPAAIADSHTPAKPSELRTFGDWAVGCDNGLSCTMASLAPEDPGFADMTVTIARAPGADGAIAIDVSVQDRDDADLELAVDDGKAVKAAKGSVGGADARRLAVEMVDGTSLTARDASGKAIASIALKGAAAAFRYVDDKQGRAGGTTAIAARGSAPAGSVPSAPALPVIVSPKPGGTPVTLSKTELAALRKRAECDLEGMGLVQDPEISALGGGKSLIVLPCSSGAYNLIAALFVSDGKTIEPARMDTDSGMGPVDEQGGIPDVVNGGFEDGILSSYAKGRGIGDCGITQSFVWDGSRFRLIEQAEMGECRGNPEFITTWRARVVRR
ncbi:DUF1176 domain-containing protein [Allosphingosinicella deserti]|nr:DUF1176 domain-containing protein [Sphingomonas deserti]